MLGVVKDQKGKDQWGCVTKLENPGPRLGSSHDDDDEEEEVKLVDNCKDEYFWQSLTLNCTKCIDVYDNCTLCDDKGCLVCEEKYFAHKGNCVVDPGSNCKEPTVQ